MEIKVLDYHYEKGIYNFTIKEKMINGITGSHFMDLVHILELKPTSKGKIIINNKEIPNTEINDYKRKISIVKSQMDKEWYAYKVYECIYQEIKRKKIPIKDPQKRILDSLKIVRLDVSYLNRNINDLSASEKKRVQFVVTLLSNPEVIIIEDFLNQIDLKTEKMMILLLKMMTEYYNKTIVLVTSDTNCLYQYSNHIIITKSQEVLVEGNTEELLQDVELLRKNNIEVPEIVEWTYLAKKSKNAKIDYHKDIRDLIKDIYKHV